MIDGPGIGRLPQQLCAAFWKINLGVTRCQSKFTVTSFPQPPSFTGISTEELDLSDLNTCDLNYPVIVAARAIKRKDA